MSLIDADGSQNSLRRPPQLLFSATDLDDDGSQACLRALRGGACFSA